MVQYNHSQIFVIVITNILFVICTFAEYDPNNFNSDNAAHWYRKAFTLYEKPTENINLKAYILEDISLTPELEQYLNRQKPVIDLTIKASQIKYCDWQYNRYKDIWDSTNDYSRQVSDNCILVLAYTKYHENRSFFSQVIANWKACFNSIQHINNPNSWDHWNSMISKGVCFSYIHKYLYRHPNMAVDDLTEINKLLLEEHRRKHYSLNDILDDQLKFAKTALTKHTNQNTDFGIQSKIITFKGETGWDEYFKSSHSFYEKYISNLRNAVNSPTAFRYLLISQVEQDFGNIVDKFYSEFDNLPKDFIPKQKDYDAFIKDCGCIFTVIHSDPLRLFYYTELNSQTTCNALLTGIPLLLEYHKGKKLPDVVPSNSFKDAFGHQVFEIIKTDHGFMLKSQSMNSRNQEYPEYKFILPK